MHLHKGEILFRQGDSGQLYHLKSGLLKIIRVHEDGVPFLMNIITPDEMIPHHSLISPPSIQWHGYSSRVLRGRAGARIAVVPGTRAGPGQMPQHCSPASGQAAHDAKANRSIDRSNANREASQAVGLV